MPTLLFVLNGASVMRAICDRQTKRKRAIASSPRVKLFDLPRQRSTRCIYVIVYTSRVDERRAAIRGRRGLVIWLDFISH